jgi:hypothetical protein
MKSLRICGWATKSKWISRYWDKQVVQMELIRRVSRAMRWEHSVINNLKKM